MVNSDKKKILFLCTGNSCRSQMAEGWANKLRGDELIAYSAGVNPSVLSTRAAMVMAEEGVNISEQYSKHIDELAGIEFDKVITLCDNAREECPVFQGNAEIIHRSFEDPTEAAGDDKQVLNEFRRIRDEIRKFVENLQV